MYPITITSGLILFALTSDIQAAQPIVISDIQDGYEEIREVSWANNPNRQQLVNLEPQLLAQQQQSRVALVIGNGAYDDAPLGNPTNDATAVKDALEGLGFQVIFETNLDWHSMDRAIEDFSERLQPGGVGLFYYAGHGVQVNGENYLLPVDAQLSRQRHVNREAVSLNTVLDFMENAENTVNVVIIDACRDNPFYRQWRSNSGNGLAEIESPPEGTIISFATEPGNVAEDGNGPHSPYTAALLEHLDEPIDIGLMFRKVRRTVFQNTEGFQRPRTDDALIGEFSLNPPSNISRPASPIITNSDPTLNPASEPSENIPSPSSVPSSATIRPTPVTPIPPSVPETTPETSPVIDLPETSPVPSPSLPRSIIFAESESNVESMYEQLESYMESGEWQKADGQAWELIRQIGNRRDNSFDRLESAEFFSFPCEDLRSINNLWIEYSNRHFGYSVQLDVIHENNATAQDVYDDDDLYVDIATDLGWPTNRRFTSARRQQSGIYDGDHINFELDAPRGHLPLIGWRFRRAGGTALLIRAERCGLQPTSISGP